MQITITYMPPSKFYCPGQLPWTVCGYYSPSHSVLSYSLWPNGLLPTRLLSMGFSGQEYWSGLPFPPPGDLPDLRIKPRSPALRAGSLPSEPPGKPPCIYVCVCVIYIHSFRLFSQWAITDYWGAVLVLYSRSLLVICFIYSSVCVSIPIFQFIPPLLDPW